MSDAPVVAGAFGTVLEAQAFVNRLDQEEIPAHVIDGEAGTTLGYLGAAIGGIKVVVLPRHLERARQVLGELHGEQTFGETFGDEGEWTCGACEAAVPGEHEVCWSCGADRSGAATPGFVPVAPESRTVGPDASRVTEPDEHRAWAHEVGESAGPRRARWVAVLLFVFGPFALVALGLAVMARPGSGGATATDRANLRTAWAGCLVLLVGLAALWGLYHAWPLG